MVGLTVLLSRVRGLPGLDKGTRARTRTVSEWTNQAGSTRQDVTGHPVDYREVSQQPHIRGRVSLTPWTPTQSLDT